MERMLAADLLHQPGQSTGPTEGLLVRISVLAEYVYCSTMYHGIMYICCPLCWCIYYGVVCVCKNVVVLIVLILSQNMLVRMSVCVCGMRLS